jgi:hypothetical protein
MTASQQPGTGDDAGLPDEFPHTVAEAVDWLESVLSDDGLAEIAAMAEDDLPSLHLGLGSYIRSILGLWADDSALMRACGKTHPDDVAAVIIEALWRKLRSRDL